MPPLQDDDARRIGPYRIVGRLGSGGMGSVFAGLDRAGARVAVKIVHPQLAANPEFRERFKREIAVARRVTGRFTARILDADAAAARPWLAAEYVPGPTLEERLAAGGPLEGDEWFGFAGGLALALTAIHGANVIHRDVKPSNVILSPDGPKLVDFGIARALDGTSLTSTGSLVGTPGWVSPEEYGGARGDAAADVHAWGLLAVYAATGRPPFGTGRPEVLAHRVMRDTVDTSAVPVRDLVDRALAKDPAVRPAAGELVAGVASAWGSPGDLTTRIDRTWVLTGDDVRWPAERSRRRTAPVLAVAVAVIAVGGVALVRGLPEVDPPVTTPTPTLTHTTSSPAPSVIPSTEPPPTPTPTPSPSPSPSESATPEGPPRTTRALAAALDLAMQDTGTASFSFNGGFTESDSGARATGTLSTSPDAFEMSLRAYDETAGRYTVRDGTVDGVGGRKKIFNIGPASKDWYGLIVASTAGPDVIRDVVANSDRMRRSGRTYSGTITSQNSNGLLRGMIESWLGTSVEQEEHPSYFTYRLTIDSADRPSSFSITWCVPMGDGGVYRSTFATTYRSWR